MSDIAAQTATIVAFLHDIGIPTAAAELDQETFLPAMMVRDGVLLYDPARLQWPGDLLHEAGHLAVTPPERRATVSDFRQGNPTADGDEMAAIAWSYAAALAAGIDVGVVFHAEGYRSAGPWVAETFAKGSYIGLPMLQYYGLARFKHDEGAQYPAMIKWLR